MSKHSTNILSASASDEEDEGSYLQSDSY